MSISERLRWSYLLSSTLPLLFIGLLLTYVLFQVQQRNAYNSQQAIANLIAGNISTFIHDLEQQLLRAARDLNPDERGEVLDSAAARLVNSSPDLRAVTVVDSSGTIVAQERSDLIAATMPVAPTDPLLFDDAIQTGRGGRTNISTGDDNQPFFQIILPVRDSRSGRLVGAISAEISAARIAQELRVDSGGEQNVAYLINSQRTMLLTSRSRGWSPPPDLSVLFEENQTVAEYPGDGGRQMVGARAPVSPVNALSWSVVVEQPASEFFVELYRSVFLLVALVALVGASTLTWALYQSRRIINPIRELSAGAQELGAGRLDYRIKVHQRDELGQLAETFNQMAGRLQHSLHEIEAQNERLRHGLELARDIQMGLLPSAPPWQTEVLSVYGRSLPASEVGGDFYTYLNLPGSRAAIAIGDISGKGVAAALLMALTSSTLESHARAVESPAALLQSINDELRQRLQANQMNAALQIAVYNPEQRTMTIANAGMVAPLIARTTPAGTLECHFVDVWGLPIGTRLPNRYHDVELPVLPGDMVIFLSDGIVEAHNSSGEMFGFERLEALVAGLPAHLSVTEVVQYILDALLAFSRGAEQHDDITIIATRPLRSSPAEPTERRTAPRAATADAV